MLTLPKSKLDSPLLRFGFAVRKRRIPIRGTPVLTRKRRNDMRLRIEYRVSLLLFFMIVCGTIALADEPAKRPQPSTDDALRQSLDSHSGDDYDRALLGDSAKPKTDKKDRATDDSEKKMNQELGSAAQREDQQEDKLLQAVKGMRDVQTRLAEGKSDAITQHVQRQVVADLQQIIDEAKKSGKCLGCSMAGNCNKPGKPGSNPGARPMLNAANDRPAGESDPNARREPKQVQGERAAIARDKMKEQYRLELQSRQRETMFEWPSDYFLPEYEREIEDYFRRLSSGKPTEEKPTAEKKPATEKP
jgi:hypothetical protein